MSLSVLTANYCGKVLSHFKCLLDNDLKELRLHAIIVTRKATRNFLVTMMPLSLFKKMEGLMTSISKIKCWEVHRAFVCDKIHPDLMARHL